MAGLTKRKQTWHLRMRVPRRYRAIESRSEITRSLRTTSRKEAFVRLLTVEAIVIAELDARLAMTEPGNSGEAYAAGIAFAASRGITYLPVQELAQSPMEDILEHIEALKRNDGPQMSRAILGYLKAPSLKLSGFAEEVARISAYDNRYKSAEQMRKWRTPRKRAVANLIKALGEDCPVLELDAAKARRHRSWWQSRMSREGQKAETANKDFANMASMLSRYHDSLEMPEPPRPYTNIRITDRHEVAARKAEVPIETIITKWFAKGAFDDLNEQARDILLMSIETGCRQSEIHDLPSDAIVLDTPIPFINVTNEDGEEKREVKNTSSFRRIPLVGVALSAARRHPNGFPRYRGRSGYSNTMNKYLRKHGLLPKTGITVGGIRHTWESRLIAARLLSDERAEMMGHSVRAARNRKHYGNDMALARKLEIAQQVMLEEPEHLKFLKE